jgi:hypothetical protein
MSILRVAVRRGANGRFPGIQSEPMEAVMSAQSYTTSFAEKLVSLAV